MNMNVKSFTTMHPWISMKDGQCRPTLLGLCRHCLVFLLVGYIALLAHTNLGTHSYAPPFWRQSNATYNRSEPSASGLLGGPHACLRKTTPNLKLSYPLDAVAHAEEIRAALSKWTGCQSKGTCGEKYMETYWMAQYNLTEMLSDTTGKEMRQAFGPYIPLLVPWTELWVKHGHYFPKGFLDALYGVLRKDVPYITLSMAALGLAGRCTEGFNHRDFPGLLVLSAGGYGHVPIPLMKPPERSAYNVSDADSESKYLTSFLGSSGTPVTNIRKDMCKVTANAVAKLNHGWLAYTPFYSPLWLHFWKKQFSRQASWRFWKNPAPTKKPVLCVKRDDWREVGRTSRASLCPRGYGRSSFRTAETIQMGLIPIYVYDDFPWVPYPEKATSIGWVTTVKGLPSVLGGLYALPQAEIRAMRQRVVSFRDSHYVMPKVLEQISKFMHWDPGSRNATGGDLRCVRLPSCPQQNDLGCDNACRWE